MFTVSSAATVRNLTTRDRVKSVLGITGTDEDAYLDILIPQVSAFVCDYLDVAAADDGSTTLARETIVETFMLREKRPLLQLARAPVVSVTSIYEDDSATALVANDDYQVIKSSGYLRRMTIGSPGLWAVRKVVATYIAGWILPDSASRNLPQPIEAAVFDLIKNERDLRQRSSHIKVDEVPGVQRLEYFADVMSISGGMPAETKAKLDPYVRHRP